jgi:hypothetical protein
MYLIMIIIIMRGENFVARLDGLGGTPVAHHWSRPKTFSSMSTALSVFILRIYKVSRI